MKIKLNFYFIFISLCALHLILIRPAQGQSQINLSKDSLVELLNKNPQHDTTRALILNSLAYLNNSADPIVSFGYAVEAKKISDSLNFHRGTAEAYRQLGMAFWNQGNLANAISYFLTGLRIAEENHLTQVEADITSNIGTAYNGMGNPKEALMFLLRALALQKMMKNKVRESAVLNNIGDSYFALKKFSEASKAYQQALHLSLSYNYRIGIETNLRNLGNVMEAMGKYDSALALYTRCSKLSADIKDKRGYVLSNKSIASIYLRLNKLSLAKNYAKAALDTAIKVKLRAIVRDIYDLLYKISEEENDTMHAFSYFKLFMTYKDSVQNLKVISDVASQRLLFENSKKQSEIEYLKKDAALEAKLIANRNLLIAISVALISLILLWLYWGGINSKKLRIKNEMLSAKNEEVIKQHRQIKLHHDDIDKLNEELNQQQQKVLAQRDALVEKNQEIEIMNRKIEEVNENLENLVAERTKTLDEQNMKLLEYAFLNAHKLRAPLARIMGLANLLQLNSINEEQQSIKEHLNNSAKELKNVVITLSSAEQNPGSSSSTNSRQ